MPPVGRKQGRAASNALADELAAQLAGEDSDDGPAESGVTPHFPEPFAEAAMPVTFTSSTTAKV
ncbi:MAG: hypothetical protein M0Z47_08020 [Actinomycetota bacterium]|nr:hypothetical protein [Actinomycetota bacterium]